jgi:hypothetical protein
MPRPLHKAWEHLVVYPNTGVHEASAAERAHKVHKFMKSKRRAQTLAAAIDESTAAWHQGAAT